MKRLVIDLGHGGTDSGAVGKNGTCESDVVLEIGKELDKLLKGCDVDYKFTRFNDRSESLSDRVSFANKFKADFFVSIHINACGDRSVRGVEVWQFDDDNKRLNDFSKGVCVGVSKFFDIRNRGVKFNKNFVVLRDTLMPACIVEVDFISNVECEKDLRVKGNVSKVARVIFDELVKMLSIKDSGELYRVCVGSFRDKGNANRCVSDAKKKGFKDAYIMLN